MRKYQMACLLFLPSGTKRNSSCMFKIEVKRCRKHFVRSKDATGALLNLSWCYCSKFFFPTSHVFVASHVIASKI